MRQSNNAIKYLMAQYRAILKHAYVKTFASAMVLGAGLIASSSQAASSDHLLSPEALALQGNYSVSPLSNPPKGFETDQSKAGSVNVSGDETLSGSGSMHFAKDITVKSGAKLTINNTPLYSDGNFTLAGELVISDNKSNVVLGVFEGNTATALHSLNMKDNTKLTIGGTTGFNVASGEFGSGTITLTGNNSNIYAYGTGTQWLRKTGELTKISANDASLNFNKTTANLNGQNTTLGSLNSVSFKDATVNMSGSGSAIKAKGLSEDATAGVLFDNTKVDLKATASGSYIYGPNINFENKSQLIVAKGASLDLRGVPASEKNKYDPSTITFRNSSLANSGTINVYGRMIIDGESTLSSTSDANIKVVRDTAAKKNASASNNAVGNGELVFEKNETLRKYLSGGGNLELASGGTLYFNDETDIAQFNYTTEGTNSGAIVLDKNNATYIKGKDLIVSKALQSGEAVLSGAQLNVEAENLTLGKDGVAGPDGGNFGISSIVATDSITLKSSGAFVLGQELEIATKDYFVNTDNENLALERAKASVLDVPNELEIKGDKGKLSITGGNWTSDATIKISSGSLAVESQPIDAENAFGIPSVLTLNGKLEFAGTDSDMSKAKLEVTGSSGSSAVVDLRDATLVTAGSGTISVSGSTNSDGMLDSIKDLGDQRLIEYYKNNDDVAAFAADSSKSIGYGMVKLNSQQFSDLTGSGSKVGIVLNSGGLVTIDGFNGDIDVGIFTSGTNAVAGKVSFNNGADADAGLMFEQGHVNFKASGSQVLDLGYSTSAIGADSMEFSTYTDNTYNTLSSGSKIGKGYFDITSAISSKNSELTIGSGATVELQSVESTDNGTLSIASNTTDNVNGKLILESNGELYVENGIWTASNIDIENNGFIQVTNEHQNNPDIIATKFTASNYNGKSGGDFKVWSSTKVEFDTMQLADSHTFDVKGKLLVNGIADADLNPKSPAFAASGTNGVSLNGEINVSGAGAVFEFGSKATSGLLTYNSTDKSLTIKDELSNANFSVDDYAQIKFNFESDKVTLDKKAVESLVQELIGTNTTGYLNLTNAKLDITTTDLPNGYKTAKWSDIEVFGKVIGSVTNDDMLRTVVQLDTGASNVRGHFAAFSGSSSSISIDGGTSLHNAGANGGFFASNGDTGPADVRLNDGGSLALVNGGVIGAITGNGKGGNSIGNDGSVILDGSNSVQIYSDNGSNQTTEIRGDVSRINRMVVKSDTKLNGKLDANLLDLDQGTMNISGGMTVAQMVVGQGSSLTAKTAEINTNANSGSVIFGNASFDSVSLKNKGRAIGGEALQVYGTLSTDKLSMTGVGINVGTVASAEVDSPSTPFVDESKSYAGNLEVKDSFSFDKNAGPLTVTTDSAAAGLALASINNFGAGKSNEHAGTLEGNMFIGSNGAIGIGTKDLEQLKQGLSTISDLKSSLYLTKSLEIGTTGNIVITGNTYKELGDYIAKFNTDNKIATPKINFANDSLTMNDHTIYLGEGGAIVVSKDVAEKAKITSSNSAVAMISFKDNGSNKGTVIADGGSVQISGDIRSAKYKVFGNQTIEYLDQKLYDLKNTKYADKQIEVTTANGFLHGFVDENGEVDLKVNANSRGIMSMATDAIHDTVVAYARGYNGPEPTQAEIDADPDQNSIHRGVAKDRWIYSYDEFGERDYVNYHNALIAYTIDSGDGQAMEQAGRMGIYGGSAQAAIAATNTTANAISSRFGIGGDLAQGSSANNGQGGSLWVAPVYRNSESSGFDTQNKTYGVDIDMYGLALGGEFEVMNNLYVGGMVNIGSGDADGNQLAAGVSNDFNYYGFGAYVGYNYDKFSVVGDVSYTVVDNDISANTAFEKMSTSFDSTSLSLGVTGQYTFDVGNDMTVMPHAGLRFSRIDIDNHSVKGSNEYTQFNGDTLNIFSVPVGVKLAKNFVSETWTMTPSLDLTLTGNFGDDAVKGKNTWTLENLETPVDAEVLDSFTYGVTAGFNATNGAFSFGVGLNYTGSSNTDDIGLNANFRMMF